MTRRQITRVFVGSLIGLVGMVLYLVAGPQDADAIRSAPQPMVGADR